MHRQNTEEQTEEEFKRELEQQTINKLRNYLCDHLEPERFFPYLQTKEYLDPESCERIRSAGTTKSRVNKMLDILIRSGPRPLRVLIKAIERNGPTQRFVTDKMNAEYLKISNDPLNIERLRGIRMQGPTALYMEHSLQPPPYEPPTNPHSGISQHGVSYAPSSFGLYPSSVSIPLSEKLQPDPRRSPQLQNGSLHPVRLPLYPEGNFPKPLSDVRRYPNSPSDAPDSFIGRFPSSFHTADFPPSYEGPPVRGAGHYFRGNSSPEPMNEILSHQFEEERKISLHVNTSESKPTVTQSITNAQEKDLSKCNSLKTGTALNNRYALPRRVPSEHDASVVTSRSSPTNASSPTPISPGNSQSASGSGSLPKPLSDDSYNTAGEGGTPTRMSSSMSTSIQPSCFTSSYFENFETCFPAGAMQDLPKGAALTKLPKPKSVGLFNQLPPARQYSTQLEPIPSIEVESSDIQISFSTRQPPTEHDDTSIIPANQSDEDTSSLEISTDSDVSEQH